MDLALIDIWNQYVKPKDVVVSLGDFHWDFHMEAVERFAKTALNGTVIHIKGNHDRWYKKDKRYMYNKKVKGINWWCCHYPLASWPSGVCLHGHCHGNFPPHPNRFDVGIDTHPEYRPYHIDELIQKIDMDILTRRARFEAGYV
jgi:calcineurin-like phosphoesterase family protein